MSTFRFNWCPSMVLLALMLAPDARAQSAAALQAIQFDQRKPAQSQREVRKTLAIQNGYYEVIQVDGLRVLPKAGRFGRYIYLHQQQYLNGDGKTIIRGIRGFFRKNGRIETFVNGPDLRAANNDVDGRIPDLDLRTGAKSNALYFFDRGFDGKLSYGGTLSLLPSAYGLSTLFASVRPASFLPLPVETYLFKFIGRTLPSRAKTRYIAHRGAPWEKPSVGTPCTDGLFPANTIPAFEQALDSGFDGFELDVRVTRDGKMVVSHDDNIEPGAFNRHNGHACLSFNPGLPGTTYWSVKKRTLQELVQCEVIGSSVIPDFATAFAKLPARVPSLREVVNRFLTREELGTIVIDIKPGNTNRIVAALLDAFADLRAGQDLAALSRKIVFLGRKDEIFSALQPVFPNAAFALEGPFGNEPRVRMESFFPDFFGSRRGSHNAVSYALSNEQDFERLPFLTYNGNQVVPFLQSLYGQGGRESGYFGRAPYQFVAWTVDRPDTIHFLRTKFPRIDYLLSDASGEVFIREHLRELAPKDFY